MYQVSIDDDIAGCTLVQPIVVNQKVLFDRDTVLDNAKIRLLKEYQIQSFYVKEKDLNAVKFVLKGWYHPHKFQNSSILYAIVGKSDTDTLQFSCFTAISGRMQPDILKPFEVIRIHIGEMSRTQKKENEELTQWFNNFFNTLNTEKLQGIYRVFLENRGDDTEIQLRLSELLKKFFALYEEINESFIHSALHAEYEFIHSDSSQIHENIEESIELEKSEIHFDLIPIIDPLTGAKASTLDINRTIAVKINDKHDARSRYIQKLMGEHDPKTSVIVAPITGMRRVTTADSITGTLIEFVVRISDQFSGSFIEHEEVKIKTGATIQLEQARKELKLAGDLHKKEVSEEKKPETIEPENNTAVIITAAAGALFVFLYLLFGR